MIENGRKVRVICVDGGRCLQARLAQMGLIPGTEIEMIRNSPSGPFVIGVMGSRLILGRGMAHAIIVA
jgi:Fe2+ transport system protein FeoA